MKITVLGTGTSTGVPLPLCQCEVCTSDNPRNQRLRASIYIELPAILEGEAATGILVDTSPDLRQQALRYNLPRIDSVLITHTHADHIFGMDDLRGFNFFQKAEIPIFASAESRKVLESIFHYCFFIDPLYEGGSPPLLRLETIEPFKNLDLNVGPQIIPIPVYHGSLEVMAFRIGNFAYLTDCSRIPEESKALLHGLEVLILDGLRYRKHPTHFTLEQAVEIAKEINAGKTYLTHMSHDVEYEAGNKFLFDLSGGSVELAFDGLSLSLSS